MIGRERTGMMKSKQVAFCPFCECEHELYYIEEKDTIDIKGEEIEYDSHYYYCPNHPEEESGFVNGKMMDENLIRARNAYRKKNGLLTSDEIVAIRSIYGLSQAELSKLLGWGGATISRYETKQIQDEAHDDILKQVRDNPMFVYRSLLRHKGNFSASRLKEVQNRLISILDENGYLQEELLNSYYIEYSEPSEKNGYNSLNVKKLVACISYIASTIKLYKTKLMKLLWYCDMVSYKRYSHSITGLVYLHQPYGALPLGPIMELKDVKYDVEYSDDTEKFRIFPNDNIEDSVLSEEDLKVIDDVLDKFKSYNTQEIVDYMHQEKAYINTVPSEIISFKYADSLIDF